MPEASVSQAADNGTQAAAQVEATKSEPIRVGGKEYGTWDEVGKAYESLNSEYGRVSQQFGDLRKQYDETSKIAQQAERWNQWWKDVQPLWGEDVEDFLRAKMTGQFKQGTKTGSAQAQGQGQWDGWELLAPQDQAQKMQEYLAESLQSQYNQRLADLARAVQETLVQKENWYQTYLNNHLGLLRKAIEHKLRDPNFDIDKTMETAAQALSGQYDPIQLGQQLMNAQTFQSQLETAKKAAYEQAKKDFELEVKNKQEEPAPLSVGGAPKFKFPTNMGSQTKNGLLGYREKAASEIYKKYGPQWFTE